MPSVSKCAMSEMIPLHICFNAALSVCTSSKDNIVLLKTSSHSLVKNAVFRAQSLVESHTWEMTFNKNRLSVSKLTIWCYLHQVLISVFFSTVSKTNVSKPDNLDLPLLILGPRKVIKKVKFFLSHCMYIDKHRFCSGESRKSRDATVRRIERKVCFHIRDSKQAFENLHKYIKISLDKINNALKIHKHLILMHAFFSLAVKFNLNAITDIITMFF
ncbi:hypothetical protein EGR_11008 [Echinococcus granulosus]|uniref:Uncharacterized protein n=1 Tax=Echinococcus granulosus TaxID=6210 RepID=W6U6X8_ECHGR|nr:hypothetical protein EGR_11008 [Echinococcus granulosus]EUB54132.1 hypothetical protein EGR_11008 [Echinococcus granulosus]